MFSRCFSLRNTFDPFSSSVSPVIKRAHFTVTSNSSLVRCFRTSSPNQALPPVLAILLGKFFKYGSAIGGRVARSWWQKLSQEKKLLFREQINRNKIVIIGLSGGIGAGGYFYYDSHLQETPITKRRRFIAFTDKQFHELAKQHLETLLKEHKNKIELISLGQENYGRVERVATKLLHSNLDLEQIKSKDWTITLIKDDESMNAFVIPCGSIFVFTGLLKLLDTDDELAVILGHEMAHAVLSHGSESASYLHILDLLFVIPLAALWALLPMDVLAILSHYIAAKITKYLFELPYDRSLESEADEVGLYMAAKACFDVRAAPLVWAKMALLTDSDEPLDIEWLSTHPKSEFRQSQLEKWLPKAYSTRENCKCPALPLQDPRSEIQFWKMVKNVPEEESLLHLNIQPK